VDNSRKRFTNLNQEFSREPQPAAYLRFAANVLPIVLEIRAMGMLGLGPSRRRLIAGACAQSVGDDGTFRRSETF
jgi:hypothetical protein